MTHLQGARMTCFETDKGAVMSTGQAIILAAAILAIGILLSGGIYEMDSPASRPSIVHRLNKITGYIDLCVAGSGRQNASCQPISGPTKS